PGGNAAAGTKARRGNSAAPGRELFQREWSPNDSRSHGGDGLGPMFNAKSCAECHHQGGVGGAGLNAHDVEVAAPVPVGNPYKSTRPQSAELDEIIKKVGIYSSGSFVLHRFGVEPGFEKWRTRLATNVYPGFKFEISSRN